MPLLQTIQAYVPKNNEGSGDDVMSDIRYICKSCALITEALRKGCDVMQLPDGQIIITEIRAVTFKYKWNDKKGKLERVQTSERSNKPKAGKKRSQETFLPEEELV